MVHTEATASQSLFFRSRRRTANTQDGLVMQWKNPGPGILVLNGPRLPSEPLCFNLQNGTGSLPSGPHDGTGDK